MAKTWEMLAVFGVNILIILLLQGPHQNRVIRKYHYFLVTSSF